MLLFISLTSRFLLLDEIKTVAVEEWLSQLSIAGGTKAKLRNIMSANFKHAMRHEWVEKNPISLVRQSAKREVITSVLDLTEISAIPRTLDLPYCPPTREKERCVV
jgi:site-specific recombinase XerD